MKKKKLVRQKIVNVVLVASCVVFLNACGKKGPPTVATGQEDFYPTFYPFVEEGGTANILEEVVGFF